MEAIRILNPIHYDYVKKRFNSTAFRESSAGHGGGYSVVSVDCIDAGGRTICEHLRTYYAETGGTAPVYWRFSTRVLPDGYQLEQETSPTQDDCHYNIRYLRRKDAERVFKAETANLSGVSICDGMDARQATFDELAALRALADRRLAQCHRQ